MGFGPAEVGEDAIADIAGDEAFVTRNDFAADGSIIVEQTAQLFGIEFLAQCS